MANCLQNKVSNSIKMKHLFLTKERKFISKLNSKNMNTCHTPKPNQESEYKCSETNFSFNDKNGTQKKFPFELFNTKKNQGKRFSQLLHNKMNYGKNENIYNNPNLIVKPSTLIPINSPSIPIFEDILSIKKKCIDLFQSKNNFQKLIAPVKDTSLPPLKQSPEHNSMYYLQIRNSAFSRLSTNYDNENENEPQEKPFENIRKQLFSTKEDTNVYSRNPIKIFNKRKTNVVLNNLNLLGTEENIKAKILMKKDSQKPSILDMNVNFKKVINSDTKIKVLNNKQPIKSINERINFLKMKVNKKRSLIALKNRSPEIKKGKIIKREDRNENENNLLSQSLKIPSHNNKFMDTLKLEKIPESRLDENEFTFGHSKKDKFDEIHKLII